MQDELRPERRRTYVDACLTGLISRTLQDMPKGCTRWRTRALDTAEGVSQSTASRWLRKFGV